MFNEAAENVTRILHVSKGIRTKATSARPSSLLISSPRHGAAFHLNILITDREEETRRLSFTLYLSTSGGNERGKTNRSFPPPPTPCWDTIIFSLFRRGGWRGGREIPSRKNSWEVGSWSARFGVQGRLRNNNFWVVSCHHWLGPVMVHHFRFPYHTLPSALTSFPVRADPKKTTTLRLLFHDSPGNPRTNGRWGWDAITAITLPNHLPILYILGVDRSMATSCNYKFLLNKHFCFFI